MLTRDMFEGLAVQNGELKSRSIKINKHRTTIRMDDETWNALREVALRELCTINEICNLYHNQKTPGFMLAVAIRVFLLRYFREATTENGHIKAGHTHIRRVRQIAEQLKTAGFDSRVEDWALVQKLPRL